MHDTLCGGRRFRTLNVMDEGNREGLAIEIGTSIPSARVVRVMEQLIDLHGRPSSVRLDNVLSAQSSPMRGDEHPVRGAAGHHAV